MSRRALILFALMMAIEFALVIAGSMLATRPARSEALEPTQAPA